MRFRTGLITIAPLLAAGISLIIFCAVPPSPLDDPSNVQFSLTTPSHADSVYYIGDTLRLCIKTSYSNTKQSLNVKISSLSQTFLDSTVALQSSPDSISVRYILSSITDLSVSARIFLSDNSTRDTSFVVYVRGRSPQVLDQSDSAIVCSLGVRCSLRVSAQGTPPLHYQWHKNTVALNGDTVPSLVFSQVQVSNGGEYFCIVRNYWNPPDTSRVIRLAVNDTGMVCAKPAIAPIICFADSFILEKPYLMAVSATGSGTLSYQWFKGSVALTGETDDSLSIASVGYVDTGVYFCRVKAGCGAVDTSGKFALHSVRIPSNNPPRFSTQPFTMAIARGTTGKSDVSIIAKDTLDGDSVFLRIDSSQTALPVQSAASIDSSKFLNVATPQNATIGNSYKIAIIADDHKGGLDTLVVSVSVFDPTASDTIRPTITSDPGNPVNSSIVADSALSLRFVIQDFNGIFKTGLVNSRTPNDTQPLTAANGSYTLIAHLKHGIDSISVFAIDNSVNRNRQTATLAYIYNRKPALVLKNPVNGAQAISRNTPFSWKATDADGDSVTYTFLLGTLSTQLEQVAQTRDTTYNASSKLFAGQQYYWRVIASDGWSSDTSTLRTFTVNNPPQISLLQPADGSVQASLPVIFTWSGADNDASDSLKYALYLAPIDSSLSAIFRNSVSHSYATESLKDGLVYQWRIIVTDGKDSTASPIRTISIPNSITFNRAYGISNNDGGNCIRQAPDSSYVVIGTLNDAVSTTTRLRLLKTAKNGDVLWSKSFSGDTGYNSGVGVITTTAGHYVIAGSKTTGNIYNTDVWLFETDNSGNFLWEKTYPNPGEDYCKCFCQTTDGGFLIAARNGTTVTIYRTDASGNLQWKKNMYSGSIGGVIQSSDGRYLLAGSLGDNAYVLKINLNGDTLWSQVYSAFSSSSFSALVENDSSEIIVCGGALKPNGGPYDYDVLISKINLIGSIKWTKTFGSTETDNASSIAKSLEGGYILAGKTESSSGHGLADGYLIRIAETGDTLWTKMYGTGSYDVFSGVCQSNDKGFAITGSQAGLWIVKTNRYGEIRY